MRFLRNLSLCFAFSVIAGSLSAKAQVDASSQLLLRPSEAPKPKATGLQSGRYTVKTEKTGEGKSVIEKKPSTLPKKKVQTLDFTNGQISQTTTVVLPPTTSTTVAPKASAPSPAAPPSPPTAMNQILFVNPPPADVVTTTTTTTTLKAPEIVLEETPKVEPPPITEQVKSLVLGDELPLVEAYKEQIHPDDVRMNRIEINVRPGVVANTSKSSYAFRDYSSFSPKISLGAEFWLTPFLGIYGDYTTTLGADVSGDPATNSKIPVQHEWTEIGLDLRRFFGMSRKSNSLQYGIHLSEYKFIAPGDDLHRVSLKSTGIGLHLSSRIPVAPSYAWIFGGKIIPRVQHSEMATGIALSSGGKGESSRVDLSLGGELKFQRQNQIVWDLTFSFEKNHFTGEGNLPDPKTGVTPKGVSVENVFTVFSLGYRWGQ